MPKDDIWAVRGVPEKTRREVKMFAVRANVSMGEALDFLIKTGLYLGLDGRFPDFPDNVLRGKIPFHARLLQTNDPEELEMAMDLLRKLLDRHKGSTPEQQTELHEQQRELRGRLWREGAFRDEDE